MTLWTIGPVSCTSHTLPDGQVQICLIASETTIERKVFPDTETAAEHAVVKMRAYRLM